MVFFAKGAQAGKFKTECIIRNRPFFINGGFPGSEALLQNERRRIDGGWPHANGVCQLRQLG